LFFPDRFMQCRSSDYIELLSKDNIATSMTQGVSPYENALTERINGIIKGHSFPERIYQIHKEAKKTLSEITWFYNEVRPRSSLVCLTPSQADTDPHRRFTVFIKIAIQKLTAIAYYYTISYMRRHKTVLIKCPICSLSNY